MIRASQTLVKNLQPNKLKQLIEAHVGGGPFSQAVIERKKHSFDILKQWDSRKCELLQVHRLSLENFVKKIEKKQNFLKNATNSIKTFFTLKLQQETEYLQYFQKKLPKLNNIYQETIIKKDIKPTEGGENLKKILDFFPNFSKTLNEFDSILFEQQEKHEKYRSLIEKTILQEIINKDNEAYEATIQKLRDEIIDVRRNLNKVTNKTADNSSKHAKMFTEALEPSNKVLLEPIDLYNSEISLVGSSQEQVNLQRKLAEKTLEFYHELQKLEINRMKALQSAFVEFLKISEEIIGGSQEYENLKQLFSTLEYEEDLLTFLDIESIGELFILLTSHNYNRK